MTIFILIQVLFPLVLIGWLAFAPPHNLLGMGIQSLMTAIASIGYSHAHRQRGSPLHFVTLEVPLT